MAATTSSTVSSVIDSAASPSARQHDVYIDAEAARVAGWPWPKLPTRDEYLAMKLESWQAAEQAFHTEARLAVTPNIPPNFGTYGAYLQQLKSQCRDEVRSDWSDLGEK